MKILRLKMFHWIAGLFVILMGAVILGGFCTMWFEHEIIVGIVYVIFGTMWLFAWLELWTKTEPKEPLK